MIMTGINGKKNNLEKIIVLFDSSINIDEIKKLQKNYNPEVISMDFSSFELLNSNQISQIPFDKFLSKNEMSNIQKTSYQLSEWYLKHDLNEILIYKNVNLGSLVQSELINILVNHLKNYFLINKIVEENPSVNFICSKNFSIFIKHFTDKFTVLESTKLHDSLPLDSLETNVTIGFKKLNFKIGIKNLNKLKSFSEKFSNTILSSTINENSNFFLFSEINTKKFSELFKKMPNFPENYVIFNRRQPSIWDKESLSIFKNSNAILENENTLDVNVKKLSRERNLIIDSLLDKIFQQDDVFLKFFILENLCFWSTFKEKFYTLLKNRFKIYSYEVDLASNLFEKYSFKGILLQNEVGPNEQILLQIAKSQKIPVYLLQHGLIFDTDGASQMNRYQGVMGFKTDYQLVWGDVDYEYRLKQGFSSKKVIKIGSSIYDNFSNNNNQKNYVLLATSGPTEEDIFDLTIETIGKNIETIKKISQTIRSMNHDLIIKTHPSPDEFDPTELVHQIDPSIRVIKSGNISELIKKCSLVIVIDFSSVILDAYLLKKPIITISVKDNGYGKPYAFLNESCIIGDITNLKNQIQRLLELDYDEKIRKGVISGNHYLSNIDSSSENLLSFLSKNQNN